MAEAKKIFLWVGLGCGTLVILGLATCVGSCYYAKKKITSEIAKDNPELAKTIDKKGVTGALTGGTGQMVASGAAIYGGLMLVPALPKDEQPAPKELLERLVKVGAQLDTQDIEVIGKAMDTVQKPHEADKTNPTAEEARTFFRTLRPIVEKYRP